MSLVICMIVFPYAREKYVKFEYTKFSTKQNH